MKKLKELLLERIRLENNIQAMKATRIYCHANNLMKQIQYEQRLEEVKAQLSLGFY